MSALNKFELSKVKKRATSARRLQCLCVYSSTSVSFSRPPAPSARSVGVGGRPGLRSRVSFTTAFHGSISKTDASRRRPGAAVTMPTDCDHNDKRQSSPISSFVLAWTWLDLSLVVAPSGTHPPPKWPTLCRMGR